MKIRVMIVEDEPMIRQGIICILPWEDMGCEVAAWAENGVEGLKKAEECRPHLVISDIRMPKMDGLTMTEQLKKSNPDVRIILLTGFQEFDYAKRAIRYGVSEYILKPIDQDELIRVVRSLTEQIRATLDKKVEKELLQVKVRESQSVLKEKFLMDLLFYSTDNTQYICEKMEYFRIQMDAFAVTVAVIDSFYELEQGFTEDDIQVLLYLIEEQMEELFEDTGFQLVTFRYKKAVYAIISESGRLLTMEVLRNYGEQLGKQMEAFGQFTVSVGISDIHTGLEEIRSARAEADRCTAQSWHLGAGSVVCCQDLQMTEFKDAALTEVRTEAYFQALKQAGDIQDEMRQVACQIVEIRDPLLIKKSVTEIVTHSFQILMEDYGESAELLERMDHMMEKVHFAKRKENYEKILVETGAWIHQYIQNKKYTRTEFIMEKALQYMQKNCRKELSLEEVADQLYISKWYFSKLFHKETGEKFSDYMSRLRIEEAGKIIRECPDLKNYEVADMVGFGNVRYFASLFKKIMGKTPSEYRG